jgi:hypothetical protein
MSGKYIFIKERDELNKFDHTRVQIESDSVSLPDLIEDFSDFLKASGFVLDGLEIVESEDSLVKRQQEEEE